jgi:adenylate cyclase
MTASKILVVDDEPDLELLISQRFSRPIQNGEFIFRFARDGQEALDCLQREPDIELVLSDINMPGMDGLALLDRLRENGRTIKAVIISAYGDMANIRVAMNRGAFDFLTKPIDLGDLDTTIRKTLSEIGKLREISQQRDLALRARANLGRYFSPNLVDILAEKDEPLGPVRRQDVAVLFADIIGFTGMAEAMAPEAVMDVLRQYHSRMSKPIFECNGTIEKFIGDAMLATFGVPEASGHDASDALRCAKRMIVALARWNEDRNKESLPPLAMGLGLNYGPAVIGDLGNEHGMAFTVIGDTVNTASRLQEASRGFDTPLVVSDALVQAIGDASDEAAQVLRWLRPVGEQRLRGRERGISVWTPDLALTGPE